VSATALRSGRAGALTRQDLGSTVRLGGWVHRVRDLGGLVFADLRDLAGLVQLSFDPRWSSPEVMRLAARLGTECVVLVEGLVAERPEPATDQSMGSRDVEVQVTSLRVVGPANTPAIPVAHNEGEELPAEELRLRHRVLDLRRPELQRNLVLRHRLLQRSRQTLAGLGFLEIETPILTRPTPEGARDYLVPSRVHPGEFYALPQSPQIYKQLLMVAGYDRYFQIARCFRDEDLRADRQPEFTQIDLEASFVSAEDVQNVIEQVLVELWQLAAHTIAAPFARLSWWEAMERFGVDKPDLRFGLELHDWTSLAGDAAAPFVRDAISGGGRLRGLVVADGALSRKDLDALGGVAKACGAGGLIWARRTEAGWDGQGVKAVGTAMLDGTGGAIGCTVLAVTGPDHVTSPALSAVRLALARRPGFTLEREHAFCWVVDFPLFEADPGTGERVFAHHPFTSPHPEDLPFLESEPARCRAVHYDAVYNGTELGSGSIRITDPALQQRVFRLLGIQDEEQRRRFGFLLDGLAAGAPPMGGFALGFDRIAMLLAGAGSLRDVIAFPKTTTARALFEGAPVPLTDQDLAELHLRLAGGGGGGS
jgi:aspartyl-tRNA synthetase